jgi:hypothetical protein
VLSTGVEVRAAGGSVVRGSGIRGASRIAYGEHKDLPGKGEGTTRILRKRCAGGLTVERLPNRPAMACKLFLDRPMAVAQQGRRR